jgi:hypothetical protein
MMLITRNPDLITSTTIEILIINNLQQIAMALPLSGARTHPHIRSSVTVMTDIIDLVD